MSVSKSITRVNITIMTNASIRKTLILSILIVAIAVSVGAFVSIAHADDFDVSPDSNCWDCGFDVSPDSGCWDCGFDVSPDASCWDCGFDVSPDAGCFDCGFDVSPDGCGFGCDNFNDYDESCDHDCFGYTGTYDYYSDSYGARYSTPRFGSSYSTPSYSSRPITITAPGYSIPNYAFRPIQYAQPINIPSNSYAYASAVATANVTNVNYTPPQHTVQAYFANPYCSITATPANVTSGQSVSLVWTSSNATSGYMNPGGSVSISGSQIVYPTNTTTYMLTVYNSQGMAGNCQVTVYANSYIPTPTPYYPPYNPQYYPPYQNLYCTITAYPTSIQNGASSILSWTSYGAISAWLSDGLGNATLNGTVSVRPESSRTYTLTVRSTTGQTNTCATTVNVSGYYPYVSLTQIPYTGLDLGPIGNALYWLSLLSFAAAGAYLLVYYKGNALTFATHAISGSITGINSGIRNMVRGAAFGTKHMTRGAIAGTREVAGVAILGVKGVATVTQGAASLGSVAVKETVSTVKRIEIPTDKHLPVIAPRDPVHEVVSGTPNVFANLPVKAEARMSTDTLAVVHPKDGEAPRIVITRN